MEKIKMSLDNIQGKLSKTEMKKIIGGVGQPGDKCNKTEECPMGFVCSFLLGHPGVCIAVPRGTSCASDDDCGNGMHCVPKPVGTGKWCN